MASARGGRQLRRIALEKIASLSAASPSASDEDSDVLKLCQLCPTTPLQSNGFRNGELAVPSPISQTPMSIGELEVLLALCKAVPSIKNLNHAQRLADQLTNYLPDVYAQAIEPSPFLQSLEPSPWELLAFELSTALLSLSLDHVSLKPKVQATITKYLHGCSDLAAGLAAPRFQGQYAEVGKEGQADPIRALGLVMSLLGFVRAAVNKIQFWNASARLELLRGLKSMMSEDFMIAIESTFSTVRNSTEPRLRRFRKILRHYAAIGRPLGAMLLQYEIMQLVQATVSLLASPRTRPQCMDILDTLRSTPVQKLGRDYHDMLESLSDMAADAVVAIDDGVEFFELESAWQQRLAFAVKASALITYLCCCFLGDDEADVENLVTWAEATLADPIQAADEKLAETTFKCMAVAAKSSASVATELSKTLPRVVVQDGLSSHAASVAADCLAFILRQLPPDATISTLYRLGNVLSGASGTEKPVSTSPLANGKEFPVQGSSLYQTQSAGSTLSLVIGDAEDKAHVYRVVVRAIVKIASAAQDQKTTALAVSMLAQKIGKVSRPVDAIIISQAATLSIHAGSEDFSSLLRIYARLTQEGVSQNDSQKLHAVLDARCWFSKTITKSSPLYIRYLRSLLEFVVSRGEVHDKRHSHHDDFELATKEITQLLRPLALLAETNDGFSGDESDGLDLLARDAWFNIAVHGFSLHSPAGKRYLQELRVLAQYSKPLIAGERAGQLESDIELNTLLRRGNGHQRLSDRRRDLVAGLPNCESEIRSLSYPEVIFVSATHLVETLRATTGDCTKSLKYFADAKVASGAMKVCVGEIAKQTVNIYISKTISGQTEQFSTPFLAMQLASIFVDCCHRLPRVQQAAYGAATQIIDRVPSALCQKASLYALLELLSMMWTSCLEAETDEYDWKSKYSSSRGRVSLELSDDFELRQSTLNFFHRRAREWVIRVLNISPMDIKGLLQTYLSEYDDEGAYGHVSLGRSFAMEMGSIIPASDQRLAAIDRRGDLNINTASDFIAQYTTRQEYRFTDVVPRSQSLANGKLNGSVIPGRRPSVSHSVDIEDVEPLLAEMAKKLTNKAQVPLDEVRDAIRKGAALLCQSHQDQGAVAHHLVNLPFMRFSKQSIKFGISLWNGVIKENPRMESRIFIEIAAGWEGTIRRRQGIFSSKHQHLDPFYVKSEFAPSDKDALLKGQQTASDLVAPHFRLLQFLESHFNAVRLASLQLQRVYHRLIHLTLDAMARTFDHPLGREVHFHIVLLAMKILKYGTSLDAGAQSRLKRKTLSAALAWFRSPPRWTFGGNRLRVKAEVHLLADVHAALMSISSIDPGNPNMRQKQDLLSIFLENEQNRLVIWLFPRDHLTKQHFASVKNVNGPSPAAFASLVDAAWSEDPSLAIQLAGRLHSQKHTSEVRSLIKRYPEKVVDLPDALQILLGPSLPNDVTSQLMYLLYWDPVNPITAVTYFMPAYGNHPFVVQYAMRALDSHSVDVTFFYVPQIVQALRYDILGYVERYIIEAGAFSQLFAHQIIWNMKANAYKDEDATEPDSIKPTLDMVMDSLISSFSEDDKGFYEREFTFFNEVTGISGKLRPFIKKSKPEKKQKIEEELRKVQVEVGVYLPSNPDGVVVGIDRKSGKPLQSHAKAPYMATFRIKKQRGELQEAEEIIGQANTDGVAQKANTYEVWQSAIFKVGDDCRQDVLALQMIAAFRGIFNNVGLDVYVFPYRVTATAPGCGVIDVLPNSISRDMLGREAVNGLYEYFVSKYGNPDSIRFQEARNNFVKSMAAYSVISYLLQFKDRHNGNIMIDDVGHILHIDFGFCFDIAPGGVRFERAPFKLTSEMVSVMGGSTDSQPYHWFEELSTKAFLASRQHVEKLSDIIVLMLDSGLPCFKPQTIQHFKERFVPEKTEGEAADFMKSLIHKSYSSYSTKGYDQFQLLTNGIPY